jgi:hypothetical protein
MPVLFNEGELRSVFEHQQKKMLEALESISAQQFRSEDDTAIAASLISKFGIVPVELTEGATSVSAEEADVDVTDSWDRDLSFDSGPHYVKGVSVSYFVPFAGDRDLFRFQPSTFTTHLPRGDVRDGEIAFHFERADSNVAATKIDFEQGISGLKQWVSSVNQDVLAFNTTFEQKVISAVAGRRSRLKAIDAGMGLLGIPVRSAAPSGSSQAKHDPLPAGGSRETERYDVALSFAGEDRAYVERVASTLRDKLGVRVFYDEFETVNMWGKNLVDHLADVYRNRSRFVVMFVSRHYVEKAWPTHERQHAQARALLAKEEYILPARFDDTDVPGMTTTVAYVDLRQIGPEEFAKMVKGKLS